MLCELHVLRAKACVELSENVKCLSVAHREIGGIDVRTISANDAILIAIPVLLVGGTEVHTLALARTLQSAGARVQVCCYYKHAPSIVQALEDLNIEVILLELEREAGLLHLFRVLRALFKRIHPSAVHVQYIAPGLIPVAAAKAAGVRTVFATVHQPGDSFGFRERLYFSVAARLCTAFFCVSQTVERSWFGGSRMFSLASAVLGHRHFTIYNGVDAVRAEKTNSQAAVEKLRHDLGLVGRHVIGVVARLRAEKGHALLLNALPLVLKSDPNAALLVVGDGPDREILLAQARALGIEPKVAWAGERSPEEVLALYGVMDVVAVPSQFEGFGLSAAEAMAAGRPVVATRVGGLAEIIVDGVTGCLVAPEDSAAFAAALIRLLGNPGQAAEMGERGRVRVAEHFSSDTFADTIVAAYRHFLERKARPGGAPAWPPPAA